MRTLKLETGLQAPVSRSFEVALFIAQRKVPIEAVKPLGKMIILVFLFAVLGRLLAKAGPKNPFAIPGPTRPCP